MSDQPCDYPDHGTAAVLWVYAQHHPHCNLQRPPQQAWPTAASGCRALPVPAAFTAATIQGDLKRPQEEEHWAWGWELRPQPPFITKAQERTLRNAAGHLLPAPGNFSGNVQITACLWGLWKRWLVRVFVCVRESEWVYVCMCVTQGSVINTPWVTHFLTNTLWRQLQDA